MIDFNRSLHTNKQMEHLFFMSYLLFKGKLTEWPGENHFVKIRSLRGVQ